MNLTIAELKAKLAQARFFRDIEGTYQILKLQNTTFLVVDSDNDAYELFYADYAEGRQRFEIIL